ncbi:MAG: aspartate aminotransferase family protein [Planctomyces sp.]|nr:aspartate aminotransferase family protein [Planctomyces sp.]
MVSRRPPGKDFEAGRRLRDTNRSFILLSRPSLEPPEFPRTSPLLFPRKAPPLNVAARSSHDTIEKFNQFVIPNYRRYPISLVHGEGSYVWDAEGNRYLDFFPGWGCNILGYSPPRVVRAIQEQVEHLIHVPNTWFTEPQGDFAEALCTRGFGKAFFCNSGAEANEGAIKLARLHCSSQGRYKIVTCLNGFHGRTYAAVTATAQPKYHEGIQPLLPGFLYTRFNDLEALEKVIDAETCAILLEPVQGEGGVNIADADYLRGVRQLCDERELLLIFDEVQTGMGRLGSWFAYQHFGVQPDIMTLAKGLCAGVACGAIIATEGVAPSLRPGMHASTFGGNPLAMAAGLATVQTIEADGLLDNCSRMSGRFAQSFLQLQKELPIIREVRVSGLMVGVDLTCPATPAVASCMERGLLVNATHDTVLRLLPPLNITAEQVDEGCDIIAEVLRQIATSG